MSRSATPDCIELTHGSGGRATAELITNVFHRHFDNAWLRQGNDYAVFTPPPGRLVISTDAHVITPLWFPGGDIGSLAVNGTINDVAMAGAQPLYLSAAFILEEGFLITDLERIVISMTTAAQMANVPIVTGDTKVVERGHGDGCFITTTGIGVVPKGINISGDRAAPGDAILISGSIGDHGVAVLAAREQLQFNTPPQSDTAALHSLVAAMITAVPDVHCLRDPTRGGLATTLNELAHQSGVGMQLNEAAIPIQTSVRGACEILGFDPLYLANEGKLVAICPAAAAETLLATMRAHSLGREAAIIGTVTTDAQHLVQMKTAFGGSRLVTWLTGDQLPRIC